MSSINPSDIYSQRRMGYISKGKKVGGQHSKIAKKFFDSKTQPGDYNYAYALLNSPNYQPPSLAEIANYQHKMAQSLYLDRKTKAQPYLDMLNLDMNQGVVGYDVDEQNIISMIHNLIGNYDWDNNDQTTLSQLEAASKNKILDMQKYEIFISQLKDLYKRIGEGTFNNDKALIDAIENALSTIKEIENSQDDNLLVKSSKTYKRNSANASKGDFKSKSLLSQLKGDQFGIQGRYFELMIIAWLTKISSRYTNIKVIDTANLGGYHKTISGKKHSSARKSKTDGIFLDMDLIDLEKIITIETGKSKKERYTLGEWLDKAQNENLSQTITAKIFDLEEIRNAIVFGVQAKSGSGYPAPFNSSSVKTSINEIMDGLNTQSGYAQHALKLFVNLMNEPYGRTNFYGVDHDKPIYQAYFNYLLGNYINNIIGSENLIIATPNKICFVDEYLQEAYEKTSKIIRALDPVNVQMPDKNIVIGFK